jgi:hypothetical protein
VAARYGTTSFGWGGTKWDNNEILICSFENLVS